MKKITLLFWFFILLSTCVNAQEMEGSDLPTLSEDGAGPWYYIQVLGTDADRKERVFTVELLEDEATLKVFSRPISSESHDKIDHQLWRFEEGFDDSYIIINKKYPDLKLSQSIWEDKNNKGILILSEDPSTEWELRERSDGGGFYHIIAKEPIDGSNPSCHMGNNGFSYSVVFEGDSYGYGGNSQFRFVEYQDKGISISKTEINFQYRQPSETSYSSVIEVLGFASLIENIKYELIDTDENIFYALPQENLWDDKEGGSMIIYFTPPDETTTPTAHSGTLKISGKTAEKEIVLEVTLQGIAVPLMPFENDTWYSIRFTGRGGGYLQDLNNSTEEMNLVSTSVYSKEDFNDSFFWKFVKTKDENFKLVSKLGNEIEWKVDTYEDDPSSESGRKKIAGYFHTASTSQNTFKFVVRTTDGAYQIQWNEARTFDNSADSTAYLNKANTHTGLVHFSSLTDAASIITCLTPENTVPTNSQVIEFSNDNTEAWYYILFNRVLNKSSQNNIGIKTNGLGETITQDKIILEDPAFHWKLVGDAESFRIVDKDGNEFGGKGEDGANNYSKIMVAQDEGNNYKLEKYKLGFNKTYNFETWQILNIGEGRNAQYINDHGGTSTLTGEYDLDGGSEIVFIKAEKYHYMGNEKIMQEEIYGDPVSITYYNLQGIQFTKKPTEGGLFIVKKLFADNHFITEKVYIKPIK